MRDTFLLPWAGLSSAGKGWFGHQPPSPTDVPADGTYRVLYSGHPEFRGLV